MGVRAILLFTAFLFSTLVYGEPWLSSRYAQHCASCHAPGRVNLPAKDRRCTLSCQGCHTNPNGGGLRNFYGKWLQERFLRNGYVQGYRLNKPKPDVFNEQPYANDKLKAFLNKPGDGKLIKRAVQDGFRMKETYKDFPDSAYDKTTVEYKVIEPNFDRALLRIPEGDPYRLRKENYFNAGLDMRYLYLDQKSGSTQVKSTFPMATDLAVSVEPVHKVSMVFESRFLDGPTKKAWDEGFSTQSQVRSAYVMVDDLPYNSFFMYGLYRPMVGNYSPDHTSLFQEASSLDMRAYFKAATFGTAPNVPFLNVHYIQPMSTSSSSVYSQDNGFAVNAGARFVTLGAYFMLTYWKTTGDYRPSGGQILDKTFTSFTGGGTLGRYTVVWDYTQIGRDEQNVRSDKGTVITLENRFRVWNESYAMVNYETLNTAINLQEGGTTQMTVGAVMFPISSMEVQVIYKQRSEDAKTSNTKTDTKYTMAQLHLFF